MKKSFILSIALLAFSLGAAAQNQYWEYQSSVVLRPSSAVSIAHSNGYIYLFMADGNGQLSVTEIYHSTMQPTGICQAFDAGTYLLDLRGVFENAQHEFVLYGTADQGNSVSPFYMVIDPTLATYSLKVVSPQLASAFIDGCNGFAGANEVYAFVTDAGELYATDGYTNSRMCNSSTGEYYTDISWDATHLFFIASGVFANNFANPTIVLDMFTVDFNAISIIPNPNHPFTTLFRSVIEDVAYDEGEYQTMHVQLDDSHLLLYRCLRDGDNDIIWLTRIENYWNNNVSVNESRYYTLPLTKLLASDLLYDPVNNRVNLLGELVYCSENHPRFLAQANPYILQNFNARQMDGGMALPTSCVSMTNPDVFLYSTTFKAQKLALNDYSSCAPVMVAGTNQLSGILTATEDIGSADCDIKLPVVESVASPQITTLGYNFNIPACSVADSSLQVQPDAVSVYDLCQDPNACFNAKKDSEEKIHTISWNPYVDFQNRNRFTCHGFDGTIRYCIYDITGRLLHSGTTYNECSVLLPNACGLLILKAIDEKGQQSVGKVNVY